MLSIMSLCPSLYSFKASLNISEFSSIFLYLPLSRMLLKPILKCSVLRSAVLMSLVIIHSDSRMLKREMWISDLISASFLRHCVTSLPVSIPRVGSMKDVSRRIFSVSCLLLKAYCLHLLRCYGCEFFP